METLVQNQEVEKPLSEYREAEIIDLIYSEESGDSIDLPTELGKLSRAKELETLAIEKIINSSEKNTSNPRVKQHLNNLEHKLEETKQTKKIYDVCRELNIYHLEGTIDLESASIDDLIEKYRLYQTLLGHITSSESQSAIEDIEVIMSIYNKKIIELLEETKVDQKYGFGNAEGRSLDIDFLNYLNVPDTNNPGFTPYRERLKARQQGNSRLLTDGQKTNIQDDFKGSESEKIVNEELIQVPGVLATIDVPKFSVGDTRHKADIIAVTINSELRESVNEQEVQLAVYKLIEEYKSILLDHIIQNGENSLINPKDNVLGDIIKVSKNIHLDDISSEIKEKNINLSNILQMHKIQVKTQSTEMPRALQNYQKSKNSVDPDKVGFLAREYHQQGDPKAEDFNRIHFQIAAQKVLGLPIK